MEDTAFISGHRDVTDEEFKTHYIPHIDNAILNEHCIVVGDYEGADYLAQRYLMSKNYKKVVVYHMFIKPRYFVDGYPTRGGYTSDEDRDSKMTQDSTYDIAWIRPNKEKSGTAINIRRRAKLKTNAAYGNRVINDQYNKSIDELTTLIKILGPINF